MIAFVTADRTQAERLVGAYYAESCGARGPWQVLARVHPDIGKTVEDLGRLTRT
jgi:hypothetical protein